MSSEPELRLLHRLAHLLLSEEDGRGLPGDDVKQIFDKFICRHLLKQDHLSVLFEIHFENVSNALEFSADEVFIRFSQWLESWPSEVNKLISSPAVPLMLPFYEDSRVQHIYGRRTGASFADGYAVVQGDWSLLDDVKNKLSIYRQT